MTFITRRVPRSVSCVSIIHTPASGPFPIEFHEHPIAPSTRAILCPSPLSAMQGVRFGRTARRKRA